MVDILSFLDRLVTMGQSASGAGLSNVLNVLLMIVVFAIVAQTVVEIVNKVKNGVKNIIRPSEHKSNHTKTNDIRTRLLIDSQIELLLQATIDTNNLNRAILFQFHNGIVMKSGMPFEYVVLTHEAVSPGVAHSNLNGKHHDMRIFSELINKIIEGDILIANTSQFSDPLLSIFRENGDTKICVKILTDIVDPDATIGFVMFSNTHAQEFSVDLASRITAVADRISGVLSNTWGKCEYCKMSKTCKDKKKRQTYARCEKMIPVEKSLKS